MATCGQPGKQQIAGGRQHRAQHEHAHHAPAHGHGTAHKGSEQGHDHAEHFGDGGHLVLAEAHVHIEGVGHDAHDHIADAIHGNQRQHQRGLPAVAADKVGKRCHQRTAQPVHQTFGRGQGGGVGLPRAQHRHHADQHAGGHDQIGDLPGLLHIALDLALYARSQPQGSGSGPDHGEPVASLVSSRQRCLVVGVGRLNAKGIQRNVLRGRAKGHSQCAPDDGVQGRERVAQRHANQPAHDHQLRQQQPAAPAPQCARAQRQRHAVHQRRPHPLEGIGQGHPAQIANGGAVDACFAQPERERAQHQQQRKPGRKTQDQHAQAGRFGIDLEGRGPGAA